MSGTGEVSFTLCKPLAGSGEFGKRVSWREGEGLVKDAVVTMSEGVYETVRLEWAAFGEFLDGVAPGEALLCGVARSGAAERGLLITKAGAAAGKEGLARTLSNFGWGAGGSGGGLLMIDVDDVGRLMQGVGGESESESEGGWGLLEVGQRVPGIVGDLGGALDVNAGAWVKPSSGARIWRADEEIVGLSGVHVYVRLKEGWTGSGKELREVAREREWQGGTGWWRVLGHRYGVSVLERGALDWSVFSPERFDFAGGVRVDAGSGLEQRRENAVLIGWGSEAGEGEGDWVRVRLDARAAAAVEAEELKARLLMEGRLEAMSGAGGGGVSEGEGGVIELGPGVELLSNDGGRVYVWQLVLFPGEWHGAGFYDVLREDKGPGKAKFFWNRSDSGGAGAGGEWEFVLNSFVGGGVRYRLMAGVEAFRALIAAADRGERGVNMGVLREGFEGAGAGAGASGGWWNLLAGSANGGREEILEALKKRGIMSKAEAREKLAVAVEAVGRLGGMEEDERELAEREEKLRAMNERWAYIQIGGKARYLDFKAVEMSRAASGGAGGGLGVAFLSRADFLSEVESEGVVVDVSDGGRGGVVRTEKGKVRRIEVGKAWLAWEGRRAYDGVMFRPDVMARDFELGESGSGRILNWFTGWGCGLGYGGGTAPADRGACGGRECGGKGCFAWSVSEIAAGREGVCESGGVGLWVRTLWELVREEEGCGLLGLRWILDWFADIFQNPTGLGRTRQTALVFKGGQGTGKNSVIDPVGRLLGDHAFTVTDMSVITGRFNSFLAGCQLLYCNEAIWGGNKKEGNKLKDLIDGEHIGIEKKGVDIVKMQSFMRLVVASNSDWVIPAEDDERRYTVIQVGSGLKNNRDWFARVGEVRPDELLWELLNYKGGSNIGLSLKTEALREQQRLSRDIVDDVLALAIEERWWWNEQGYALPVLAEDFRTRVEGAFRESRWEGTETIKKRMFARLRKHGWEAKRLTVRVGKGVVNVRMLPDLGWFSTAMPGLLESNSSGTTFVTPN